MFIAIRRYAEASTIGRIQNLQRKIISQGF